MRRVVANEVKNLVGGLRETGQIINLDNHSKPSVGLPFASFPSKKNDYLWQDAKKYVWSPTNLSHTLMILGKLFNISEHQLFTSKVGQYLVQLLVIL